MFWAAFDGTWFQAIGAIRDDVLGNPSQQQLVELFLAIALLVQLQVRLEGIEAIDGSGEAKPVQRAAPIGSPVFLASKPRTPAGCDCPAAVGLCIGFR